MPVLKRVNEGPPGQFIELKADSLVIGRAPECDLVLTSQGVSRRHAEIKRLGPDLFLCDLHARNRTKVNDRDLTAGEAHPLKNGDRINICDVEFVYYIKLPTTSETARDKDEMLVVDGDDGTELHSLDASRSDLQLSAVRPEAKLRAVLEISRSLSSELDIDAVAPKVLDCLFELFRKAERGFLVLREEGTNKLIRKAFKHRQLRSGRGLGLGAMQTDEVPQTLSRTIVNHVVEQKKAYISRNAGADSNLPTNASIADLKIRSVMCAPLLTPDGKALGILQLDTSDLNQFNEDDLDLLDAVAKQAAISIQNATLHSGLMSKDRIDRDLKQANRIQKMFLPRSVPKIAGYEFFAHYNAAYEVGGDYYDFVPLSNNRIAVVVADVSGKGVAAALMMAKFSGDTRYCILTEDAPAPAADALNQLLCDAMIDEKFITLGLGILDIEGRRMTVSLAGHPPMLVKRKAGHVDGLGIEKIGFPLGTFTEAVYQQEEVVLEPGDVAVFYSDGITDAQSPQGEPYVSAKVDRLKERLTESVGGPEAIGKSILQHIREFSAGARQFDDMTLVCLGPV
jgi:serine phosphatase RsbU (regulator of sigma subunit)